jgi:hypothetical protein
MRKSEVNMRLRLLCAGVFGIVALVTASASAQWPLHPAAGTPRASSGRVLLDAPTPRTPDGKPDLSGVWQTVRTGSGQVIFTDGRALPSNDPQPWWYGYSTGKWDGDTLVVETSGFRDDVWLDVNGAPLTSAGKMTERFRRLDYGTLEIEFVCAENEKSTQRFAR